LSAPGSVRRIVDLLDEPETIRDLLSRDRLGEGHVRYLTRIKDKRIRIQWAKRAGAEGWTVKMTEERVAKKLGDRPKAAARKSNGKKAKPGPSYENDYNHFHCALVGEEVVLSGRNFKMNEEMLDQYVADFRAALESFVRDVRDRPATPSAPESSGELASSTQPSPDPISTAPAYLPTAAQMSSAEVAAGSLDDAANFRAAGQELKDILSQIAKQPGPPKSADPGGEGAKPVKPPE